MVRDTKIVSGQVPDNMVCPATRQAAHSRGPHGMAAPQKHTQALEGSENGTLQALLPPRLRAGRGRTGVVVPHEQVDQDGQRFAHVADDGEGGGAVDHVQRE